MKAIGSPGPTIRGKKVEVFNKDSNFFDKVVIPDSHRAAAIGACENGCSLMAADLPALIFSKRTHDDTRTCTKMQRHVPLHTEGVRCGMRPDLEL
jgi:hypothetical protein